MRLATQTLQVPECAVSAHLGLCGIFWGGCWTRTGGGGEPAEGRRGADDKGRPAHPPGPPCPLRGCRGRLQATHSSPGSAQAARESAERLRWIRLPPTPTAVQMGKLPFCSLKSTFPPAIYPRLSMPADSRVPL